jgi:hypothetical protein
MIAGNKRQSSCAKSSLLVFLIAISKRLEFGDKASNTACMEIARLHHVDVVM